MSAVDRTLLASLGFADPDKRETDHDLACIFLSEPSRALRVYDICFPSHPSIRGGTYRKIVRPSPPFPGVEKGLLPSLERLEFDAKNTPVYEDVAFNYVFRGRGLVSVEVEKAICKGEDRYKTTVGFADVYMETSSTYEISQEVEGWDLMTRRNSWILVEVKIARVSASAVLRQMNLYSEYLPGKRVVVSRFSFTSAEENLLRSQGVEPIRLGASFEEWKKSSL